MLLEKDILLQGKVIYLSPEKSLTLHSLHYYFIINRTHRKWLTDAQKAYVTSWYEHDSNQTLVMLTQPCVRKRCQCCKMITHAVSVKSSAGVSVKFRQTQIAQQKMLSI